MQRQINLHIDKVYVCLYLNRLIFNPVIILVSALASVRHKKHCVNDRQF